MARAGDSMPVNDPADLLVCYDIADPRRLARVHRVMRRWGMPLQYSVFYCALTRRERRRLESILRSLIREDRDDVRVYGLRGLDFIQFHGEKPLGGGLEVFGS